MSKGVLDYLTGFAGMASGPISQAMANYENERLIDKRNAQAIAQWNRENAYNNPINQMLRLKAAGLNPNLMYGQLSGQLGAAASPDMASAQVSSTGFRIDPLTAAQIDNLNADSEQKRSKALETNTLLPFNVQNLKNNNDVLKHEVGLLDAQKQDIYMQWTFSAANLVISDKTADAQISLWNSQKNINEQLKLKTAEEYRQLCALYTLKRQGLALSNEEARSRIHVNEAEYSRLSKMIELYDSQIYSNYHSTVIAEHAEGRQSVMAEFDARFKDSQTKINENQAQFGYFGNEVRGATRAGHKGFRSIFKKSSYTD